MPSRQQRDRRITATGGSIRVARLNVYNKVVPFVPFTKLVEESIKGTHDGTRR
jgi:hypothetical protein